MPHRCFVQGTLLPTAQTTQYAFNPVPGPGVQFSGRVILRSVTVSNTSAAAVTFTLNIVNSGGTVGAANRIVPTRSVAANTVASLTELAGQVLMHGDFISTTASAASALSLRVSGEEVS